MGSIRWRELGYLVALGLFLVACSFSMVGCGGPARPAVPSWSAYLVLSCVAEDAATDSECEAAELRAWARWCSMMGGAR